MGQLWTASRHPAFAGLHLLPERPGDEPGFEDAVAAAAASNHQHPDHDTDGFVPRAPRAAGEETP